MVFAIIWTLAQIMWLVIHRWQLAALNQRKQKYERYQSNCRSADCRGAAKVPLGANLEHRLITEPWNKVSKTKSQIIQIQEQSCIRLIFPKKTLYRERIGLRKHILNRWKECPCLLPPSNPARFSEQEPPRIIRHGLRRRRNNRWYSKLLTSNRSESRMLKSRLNTAACVTPTSPP